MKNRPQIFSLRTACLVIAAATLGAWLAPLLARAAGSRAGSASLSFAGTLRQNGAPLSTAQTVAFVFKKNGVAVCQSPDLTVTPDEAGQFVAAIPIANCPSSLFDGSEVKIDIAVGGELAVVAQPITSVPSAKFAEQVGFPDCPVGYDRDASITTFVLCRSGFDEVVRVGAKSTAFWVDRYEASVWERPDGTGFGYDSAQGYPIPRNGQLSAAPAAYAVSKSGVLPSTSITWFQADIACRASGKRLPTNNEWASASSGTVDPGASAGEAGACRTTGALRVTGPGLACTSAWGAQDMIGNASEWISDWYASPPTLDEGFPYYRGPWGPAHGDDATVNLSSFAGSPAGWSQGLPAGATRGGDVGDGVGAGVFTINLSMSPISAWQFAGFRCVIPR
jgi:hypothetical protein